MKKRIVFVVLIMILSMVSAVNGKEPAESTDHIISIETGEEKITVEETFNLEGENNEMFDTITFWIQNGATDLTVKCDETTLTQVNQNNNVYTFSISDPDITNDSSLIITVSYDLPKDTASFQKELLVNNTASLSIKKDNEELFSANNMNKNSYFDLELYEITETPLSWYIIVFIVVLIILLFVTAFYSLKKQKSVKKRDTSVSGSKEFLSTKKTLLMSLLKDIEKQHRSGKISDDTYHKLKEQYKQEAVDAMKKLEDIK